MYDSCWSEVFQCMTPEGVKYVSIIDYYRSHMSICMTPAGVSNLHA